LASWLRRRSRSAEYGRLRRFIADAESFIISTHGRPLRASIIGSI
jgi:hypothetical protein